MRVVVAKLWMGNGASPFWLLVKTEQRHSVGMTDWYDISRLARKVGFGTLRHLLLWA